MRTLVSGGCPTHAGVEPVLHVVVYETQKTAPDEPCPNVGARVLPPPVVPA